MLLHVCDVVRPRTHTHLETEHRLRARQGYIQGYQNRILRMTSPASARPTQINHTCTGTRVTTTTIHTHSNNTTTCFLQVEFIVSVFSLSISPPPSTSTSPYFHLPSLSRHRFLLTSPLPLPPSLLPLP